MSDNDKIPHIKKAAFIAAYIEHAGNVSRAAEAAKIDRRLHYEWMADDPAYPALFAQAKREATARMVDEATRRAYEGVKKPIYQQGKKVGVVQEYSDTLMIFLLKGLDPETFRERSTVDTTASVTVGGKIGYQAYADAQPVEAQVETLPPADRSDDDKEDSPS